MNVITVSLKHLADSPSNPRENYSEASIQELADSIKSQGVLQPVKVRKLGDARRFPLSYELVFGHRRTRAARLAGLEFIDAIECDMTDEQVATAQIHENLAREDVTPLEEAKGFQRLMREFNVPARQIMADTGKGKGYFYGRLKLLNACDEVRAAMVDGLPTDVALKISRIPTAALQRQALDEVRHTKWVDGQHVPQGWMSARDGLEALEDQTFFIPLAEAKFNVDDYRLHPEGRVCGTCPHNSRNDPDASEAFSADTCTDVPCFELRTEASRLQRVELHRAAGTLIEGDDAGKAWRSAYVPYWVNSADGVMRLNDRIADGQGNTVREVIDRLTAKGEPTPVLYLIDMSGNTQMVLHRKDLPTLWAAAELPNPWEEAAAKKVSIAAGGQAGDDDDDDDQPSLALPLTAEEAAANEHWTGIRMAIMRAAAQRARTVDDLRVIAAATIESCDGLTDDVTEVMGWTQELEATDADVNSCRFALTKLPELSPDKLALLILLMAIDYGPPGYGRAVYVARVAMARTYGVNPLDPDAPPAEAASTPSTAARAQDKGARDVRYRNAATGETWSGRGQMPAWLKAATAAGAKLTDYAVQADLVANTAGSAVDSSSTTPAAAGGVVASRGLLAEVMP